MTTAIRTQPQTISKTVAGKTVTMTPEQADAFGRELDALKERVIADLGERDTTYIRRIIKAQRGLEVAGRALLFGVSPTDPLVFIVIALLVAASSGITIYLPARRASRLDPLTMLRSE